MDGTYYVVGVNNGLGLGKSFQCIKFLIDPGSKVHLNRIDANDDELGVVKVNFTEGKESEDS